MEALYEEQPPPFEMGVVVSKRVFDQIGEGYDCVQVLVDQFRKIGLIVDRVAGLNDEFLKIAAPVEVLGKAAAELRLKKRTQIGVDLQFEWDEADAFIKQSDGSLFSWCERFRCYKHMIYGIVSYTCF
ncbi:putative anoctamin [Helianthus annuus]|nr:putative anoctamin [Helianthus annuus]KAJ0713512.1 putative anoctamin [Helianthus annuus]